MPLTIELTFLVLSSVLGFVHIVLASQTASLQRGYRWTASARDDVPKPLTGVAGRLERASRNFLETFPFFAAAVLIAHAVSVHTALTEWGAQSISGPASSMSFSMRWVFRSSAPSSGMWPRSAFS